MEYTNASITFSYVFLEQLCLARSEEKSLVLENTRNSSTSIDGQIINSWEFAVPKHCID